MKTSHRHRNERGGIAVMVAACLTGLIGFTSLTVDIAVLYIRKQAHQNICDAAALAGAMAFIESNSIAGSPGPPATGNYADAATAANLVAQKNGLTGSISVSVTFPAENKIQVQSSEAVPMALGGIINRSNGHVRATGIADVVIPNVLRSGLRPFGLDSTWMSTVTYGTLVNLKLASFDKNGQPSGGNFLAVDLNGSGASNYDASIKAGAPGAYRIGDTLSSETGNMAGPTDHGVNSDTDSLINQASINPWNTEIWGSSTHPVTVQNPRVIALPVTDWSGVKGGKTDVTILGFAEFYVVSSVGNGQVTGYFFNFGPTKNLYYDPSTPQGQDYNVFIARLRAS